MAKITHLNDRRINRILRAGIASALDESHITKVEHDLSLKALKTHPYESGPNPKAKITRVLRDEEGLVVPHETTLDLLRNLGGLIDSSIEPPIGLFQVEGDDRWWVARVEGVISEANPALVAESLAEAKEAEEDEEDDES